MNGIFKLSQSLLVISINYATIGMQRSTVWALILITYHSSGPVLDVTIRGHALDFGKTSNLKIIGSALRPEDGFLTLLVRNILR